MSVVRGFCLRNRSVHNESNRPALTAGTLGRIGRLFAMARRDSLGRRLAGLALAVPRTPLVLFGQAPSSRE